MNLVKKILGYLILLSILPLIGGVILDSEKISSFIYGYAYLLIGEIISIIVIVTLVKVIGTAFDRIDL